jgi:hypothetical protein
VSLTIEAVTAGAAETVTAGAADQGLADQSAVLAVGLDDSRLEVQLAATRLPLTPLLEQAAVAVRQATKRTPLGVFAAPPRGDRTGRCGADHDSDSQSVGREWSE